MFSIRCPYCECPMLLDKPNIEGIERVSINTECDECGNDVWIEWTPQEAKTYTAVNFAALYEIDPDDGLIYERNDR